MNGKTFDVPIVGYMTMNIVIMNGSEEDYQAEDKFVEDLIKKGTVVNYSKDHKHWK